MSHHNASASAIATPSMAAMLVTEAAHRIRNPLAGLSATVQLLEQEIDSTSPHHEALQVIHHEVDRAAAALAEAVVLAQPPIPVLESVDLAAAVHAAAYQRDLIIPKSDPLIVHADRATLTAMMGLLFDSCGSTTPQCRCSADAEVATCEIGADGESTPADDEVKVPLSLAVCRAALRDCRGTLEATYHGEKGWRFILMLPLAAPATAPR